LDGQGSVAVVLVCPEAKTSSKLTLESAAVNTANREGVAIKKVTNVFSKKILAKRALRELKLLQHFRGMSGSAGSPHCND
jgi:hypothetical protein